MSGRKSSSITKKKDDSYIQLSESNPALLRAVVDLTNVTAELAKDIEKLDTYVTAIEHIIDGKYTPYDEVNQLRDMVNEAKKQSEIIQERYLSLVSFLSATKNRLGLSDTVVLGDSNG